MLQDLHMFCSPHASAQHEATAEDKHAQNGLMWEQ